MAGGHLDLPECKPGFQLEADQRSLSRFGNDLAEVTCCSGGLSRCCTDRGGGDADRQAQTAVTTLRGKLFRTLDRLFRLRAFVLREKRARQYGHCRRLVIGTVFCLEFLNGRAGFGFRRHWRTFLH